MGFQTDRSRGAVRDSTSRRSTDPPALGDSRAASATNGRRRLLDGWIVIESLAMFMVGAVLMHFIYSGTRPPGTELGVSDHDSFYHIKMAAMIPDYGLVKEFPWLQFTYFTDEGHDFVSHHYGFHMMMVPFVKASEWWTENHDWLAGGRLANCVFFGLNLMLFNLLLASEGVRWRGVWLLLFLLLPDQFFGRHTYVRAISPSLMFMLLLLLMLFRRRYIWAGIVVALYIHAYLGAVMYAPVIVIMYVAAKLLGPHDDREIAWKPAAFTLAGWCLGIVTHPYFHGVLEFLKLQVFGTGLSPDIDVGVEWRPYEGMWWWAMMCGPLLLAWTTAICVRFRTGPPLSAHELCALLLNFAFAVLCFKSRRFIEYWPLFCLLSAGLMLRPVTQRLAAWWDEADIFLRLPIIASGLILTGFLVLVLPRASGAAQLLVEWRAWAVLGALCLAAPLARAWIPDASASSNAWPRRIEALMLPIWAAVFGVVVAGLSEWVRDDSMSAIAAKLVPTWHGWLALAIALLAVSIVALWLPGLRPDTGTFRRMGRTGGVLLSGLTVLVSAIAVGADRWINLRRSMECDYDIDAVRGAMNYLKQNSQQGDVVFTDDWDVFCAYFYYNTHNYYIVGLDPKFTHHRRPDLWERYVRITRAQAPTDSRVKMGEKDGQPIHENIHIRLEDIRDHFGAKYVITDKDHKSFATKLAQARTLAELVYPSTSFAKSQNEPLLIFRIRGPNEPPPPPAEPLVIQTEGPAYLSQLTPEWVTQGWGGLMSDRTVEDKQLRLGDKTYARGLGTHAPSELRYTIPKGYATFEAVAGIDQETGGQGSAVVSVYLDGRRVFESSVLTGQSPPVTVSVPLGDAKEIMLKADPTGDGNRFDHVDWAEARFVRAGESSRESSPQAAPSGESP